MAELTEQVLREWARARRESIDAKRQRNRHECDELNPCWRSGDLSPDWCDECEERQRFHDLYRAAAQRKAVLTRKLVRIGDKLIED